MNYSFRPQETTDALIVWPRIESFVKDAVDRSPFTLMSADDFRDEVRVGRMRLWLVYSDVEIVGAFLTELPQGSNGRAVNVAVLGGKNMNDWIDNLTDTLVSYAREQKCRYVVEMGRSGWSRVLSKLGWIEAPVAMMKVV